MKIAALIFSCSKHAVRPMAEGLSHVSDFQNRLAAIVRQLHQIGYTADIFERRRMPSSLDAYQFVLTAGGDGTLLAAAHTLCDPERSYLCGVRMSKESIGFLCSIEYEDLSKFMHKLQDTGDPCQMQCTVRRRLQCFVDGHAVPFPVLNEVLIANVSPARASRYRIAFGGAVQEHCSSGIWIAAPAGTHAAAHAAGAEMLSDGDTDGVFCVRELSQIDRCIDFEARGIIPIRTARFYPEPQTLDIEIASDDMCLFGDGAVWSYPLVSGQHVTFAHHPAPLRMLLL